MVRRLLRGMDPVAGEARTRASALTREVRMALPAAYHAQGIVSTQWYGTCATTMIKTAEVERVGEWMAAAFPYAVVRTRERSVAIDWKIQHGQLVTEDHPLPPGHLDRRADDHARRPLS